MRILSLVVAAVLALSFSGSRSVVWGSPLRATIGDTKTAAKREKPKATAASNSAKAKTDATKPGGKSDVSSFGSAARRELLKNRAQGMSKTTKGKPAALKAKSKAKS